MQSNFGLHIATGFSSAMLVMALASMPYGYYQVLRIVVCLCCAYLAVAAYQKASPPWMWCFVGLALLYNPVTSVHLGRTIWSVVNVATIVIIAVNWFRARKSA